ncbi:MAG: ribosomal L7Ae/L30e/S12e/Gadd45 family protein [Clostridiales bacterium]|jgi:large subunit ribosomal protein L7A|nr:ribosomal L7Ae/L30e/S12e/Gadd45 family protein [Clostridiales bacterium]
MYKELLKASSKLVGLKQTERGVIKGAVVCVVVAFDAEERIRLRFAALSARCKVRIVDGPSMRELGALCGIDVGASVVGILKENKEC